MTDPLKVKQLRMKYRYKAADRRTEAYIDFNKESRVISLIDPATQKVLYSRKVPAPKQGPGVARLDMSGVYKARAELARWAINNGVLVVDRPGGAIVGY